MIYASNRRQLMFSEIGKLLLGFIASYALMLIPISFLILRYGVVWTRDFLLSSPLALIAQSLCCFLLPLCLYRSGRSYTYKALEGSVAKLKAIRIKEFVNYAILCIAGSMLLSLFSEFVLEHLPQSWGISIEDPTAKFVEKMLKHHSSLYLVEIFAICVIPAFVEELFFRSVLQRHILVGVKRIVLGVLISAAIFSFWHLSIIGFLSRLWLGFLLGWLYHRRANIYSAMALHFVNNLSALIITILMLN